MLETARLSIVEQRPGDKTTLFLSAFCHQEMRDLDPPVGEYNNPKELSVLTKDGRYMGMCCTYNLSGQEIEVGTRIMEPADWDKGYGKEIMNALCEYVFSAYPEVNIIVAKTPTSNIRALKCYQGCEFITHHTVIMDGIDMTYLHRTRKYWYKED